MAKERTLHIIQKLDGRFAGVSSMTRSEAIERMAKALFKVDNVLALDIEFEQLEKQKQLAYNVFAEAALNALFDTNVPKDNKNQN